MFVPKFWAIPNNWNNTSIPLFLFSVIATMRDLKKKDKLVEAAGDAYSKTLILLPLDVCSDESVKQCINSVKDRHIDILSERNSWKESTYKLYNEMINKMLCGLGHFLSCMNDNMLRKLTLNFLGGGV